MEKGQGQRDKIDPRKVFDEMNNHRQSIVFVSYIILVLFVVLVEWYNPYRPPIATTLDKASLPGDAKADTSLSTSDQKLPDSSTLKVSTVSDSLSLPDNTAKDPSISTSSYKKSSDSTGLKVPTTSDNVSSKDDTKTSLSTSDKKLPDSSFSSTAIAKILDKCTTDQLNTIKKHLSYSKCQGNQPWLQQCSLTKATHCVEPRWLYDHYRNDYDDVKSHDGIWIGMNVGCNKGFDAINMARMLSQDTSTFEREKWKKPMKDQGVRIEVGCELQSIQYEPIKPITRIAHVYCVEPMPLTVNALQHSAKSLQIPSTQLTSSNESTNGSKLTIIKAAIGLNTTEKGALFPAVIKADELEHNKVQIGTENIGLGSSASKCDPNNPTSCEEVPVLSLDDFVTKYVTPPTAGLTSKIKMITIDVEGYDFDVVLGGVDTFRNLGVEYVEVEYNWVGSWKSQKLRDFIDHMLKFQYACYWAGKGELWRITGCFLDFFEFHTWANIACASTIHNPKLAMRMERIFLETLANETIAYGY